MPVSSPCRRRLLCGGLLAGLAVHAAGAEETARFDSTLLVATPALGEGLFARTVTIKVRYGDFTTVTRSDTREPASRDPETLAARAVALLARTEAPSRPGRLLGVSLHGLVEHPLEAPEPPPGTTRPLPFED